MRRFIAPVAVAGRPYRAVAAGILVGLLAAACGPIDYAETLRYEGQDYRTKCRAVRSATTSGTSDCACQSCLKGVHLLRSGR
jgi:hypothetical protein